VLPIPLGGMDLAIGPPVAAVHVLEEDGSQAGAIEGRVEGAALRLGATLHENLPELQLPGPPGFFPDQVEIPVGSLCLQVRQGSRLVHVGEAHLQEERLTGGHGVEGEEGPDGQGRGPHVSGGELVAREDAQSRGGVRQPQVADGTREGHGEEDPLIPGPPPGETVPRHQGVAHHPDAGLDRGVPVDGVAQVQEEGRLFRFREGVPMHPHPCGGGELRPDLLVQEVHGVVSGGGFLPVMGEAGAGGPVPTVSDGDVQGNVVAHGHHQDVQEVPDAGAAQVGVAESHQEAVLPVVARDPVPPLLALVRAQLHHPPRDGGPGVDVAVAPGADEGVHVAGKRLEILGPSPSRRPVRGLAGEGEEAGGCGDQSCGPGQGYGPNWGSGLGRRCRPGQGCRANGSCGSGQGCGRRCHLNPSAGGGAPGVPSGPAPRRGCWPRRTSSG
jgi:hypothetical protein